MSDLWQGIIIGAVFGYFIRPMAEALVGAFIAIVRNAWKASRHD
jgi:hypothetical protein